MYSLEKTLVMLKPDIVRRGLIGEIITLFEKRKFTICKIQNFIMTKDLFMSLYGRYKDMSFFAEYSSVMVDQNVVVMILEGKDIIKRMRVIIGSTDPIEATPGTIRGDFSASKNENSIHASDSYDSFVDESVIFFGK